MLQPPAKLEGRRVWQRHAKRPARRGQRAAAHLQLAVQRAGVQQRGGGAVEVQLLRPLAQHHAQPHGRHAGLRCRQQREAGSMRSP